MCQPIALIAARCPTPGGEHPRCHQVPHAWRRASSLPSGDPRLAESILAATRCPTPGGEHPRCHQVTHAWRTAASLPPGDPRLADS
ncbi:unnamed protein product, partial [Staurois parvus]